jgi:hypothetical protein
MVSPASEATRSGGCRNLTSVFFTGDAPFADSAFGSSVPFFPRLDYATIYYLPNTTGWGNTFDNEPTVMLNGPPQFGMTGDGLNYVSDGVKFAIITGYAGSNNAVAIPAIINGLPVTSVGAWAFFLNGVMTSVTIPDSVTSIGDCALEYCSLTSVTIPNSVTNIGTAVFEFSSLANVTLGSNVTSIGPNSFEGCQNLTSVTIPNSIISLEANAFQGCANLTTVTLGSSVTSIEVAAFNNCYALTEVTIPDSVTNLGLGAFDGCTDLTNANIGNGVTSIGDWAFAGCGLTSITIPNSVISIGDGAFTYFSSLATVYFTGNAPGFGSGEFDYDNNITVYYLPDTTGWNDFFANTGVPAVPWLPQVQTGDASFGVRTNQFGFNINWASGQTVVVEACSNLANPVWQPVQTNTLTSDSVYFSDPQLANYPARFYRLHSP